jgi:hypothetical protein
MPITQLGSSGRFNISPPLYQAPVSSILIVPFSTLKGIINFQHHELIILIIFILHPLWLFRHLAGLEPATESMTIHRAARPPDS